MNHFTTNRNSSIANAFIRRTLCQINAAHIRTRCKTIQFWIFHDELLCHFCIDEIQIEQSPSVHTFDHIEFDSLKPHLHINSILIIWKNETNFWTLHYQEEQAFRWDVRKWWNSLALVAFWWFDRLWFHSNHRT